jgi:zinc transporter ZupT
MVVLFLTKGERLIGPSPIPPDALLRIGFERLVFRPGEVIATVRNTGPDEVTIAQVAVNEALWQFAVTPRATLGRMERATVTIPYLWETGDPVEVKLITSNGLVFVHKVDIAAETPQPSLRTLGVFALLGVYVGVIPVYLGLLWFPFLRRVRGQWFHFFLSVTAGLLIFLGVDALKEALEAAGKIPGAFKGVGIVLIGISVGLLGLMAVGERTMGRARRGVPGGERLALAYLIAAGIGLHNLGEGLAIGAAYALGNVALGTFLIVGFTIHNTTEGFGVVAPVAKDRVGFWHLVAMGLLAGAPTILGTWIGGFTYSAVWSILFLALGAGAIFQVVYELLKLMGRDARERAGSIANFVGLILGLGIMYLTGLLVQF